MNQHPMNDIELRIGELNAPGAALRLRRQERPPQQSCVERHSALWMACEHLEAQH
jgi:hypothetical protein